MKTSKRLKMTEAPRILLGSIILLSILHSSVVNSFKFHLKTSVPSNIKDNVSSFKCEDSVTASKQQPSWKPNKNILAAIAVIPLLIFGGNSYADDELANYASQGHKVGVDGQCFIKKCAIETTSCANNPNCLKGLACLSRCKGASLCSTGCFAKYGGEELDNLLYCSVEKNDCVHVPRADNLGWVKDKVSDLPTPPLASFHPQSLRGTWYKIMGLDTRYDCFDCQKNSFAVENKKTLEMKALFRIPRPNFPGYLQSTVTEELISPDPSDSISHLQAQGKMFGLTFWENWYVLGEHNVNTVVREKQVKAGSKNEAAMLPRAYAVSPDLAAAYMSADGPVSTIDELEYENEDWTSLVYTKREEPEPDLKLVFYTGHTLQGNYKGAFLYSRSPNTTPKVLNAARAVIRKSGLNPDDFCLVRNTCFLQDKDIITKKKPDSHPNAPFWYIGQRFFQDTEAVGKELADWFEDPMILSDWLVNQQQRMILRQPLEVSPFASLSHRHSESDNQP